MEQFNELIENISETFNIEFHNKKVSEESFGVSFGSENVECRFVINYRKDSRASYHYSFKHRYKGLKTYRHTSITYSYNATFDVIGSSLANGFEKMLCLIKTYDVMIDKEYEKLSFSINEDFDYFTIYSNNRELFYLVFNISLPNYYKINFKDSSGWAEGIRVKKHMLRDKISTKIVFDGVIEPLLDISKRIAEEKINHDKKMRELSEKMNSKIEAHKKCDIEIAYLKKKSEKLLEIIDNGK